MLDQSAYYAGEIPDLLPSALPAGPPADEAAEEREDRDRPPRLAYNMKRVMQILALGR
jgi:hypothetical protein